MRREKTVTGSIYHVFNKSIAGFIIYTSEKTFSRMRELMRYYQIANPPIKFSKFIRSKQNKPWERIPSGKKLIEIIAYCIMPTHIHLLLKQLEENGISIFMRKVLDSYSRFFNIKHNRKGPLWEGRSKKVLVRTDEQLLHLTRYIHLNPVTAHLVDKPEEWYASSYREYINIIDVRDRICNYNDVLEINPESYKKFVEDRISYQRDLHKIKKLLCE